MHRLFSLVAQEARASKCLPPEPTSTKHKCQLQWLRRWRRRWNISLGCIPARENVPPDEARRKVMAKSDSSCRGSVFDRFLVPLFATNRNKNGVHYMDPVLGPQYQNYQDPWAIFRHPFLDPRAKLFDFLGNGRLAVGDFFACSHTATRKSRGGEYG